MEVVQPKKAIHKIVWSLIILNIVIISTSLVTNGFFKMNYLSKFYSNISFVNLLIGLVGGLANNLIALAGLIILLFGRKSFDKNDIMFISTIAIISIITTLFFV